MTANGKSKATTKRTQRSLTLIAGPNDDKAAILARTYMRPAVQAAMTVRDYAIPMADTEVTLDALVCELSEQSKKVIGGDLGRGEAMLTAQAHTLDAIFGECVRRARVNMGEYTQTAELYLRVGLRAQAQCRATWETLAAIKNPPVVFARQANIAAGPQQVNNAAPATEGSRARETETQQNKLLEAQDGQRLDTGATGTAGGANPSLAAVEAVHRAEDGSRQG